MKTYVAAAVLLLSMLTVALAQNSTINLYETFENINDEFDAGQIDYNAHLLQEWYALLALDSVLAEFVDTMALSTKNYSELSAIHEISTD